jgi:protein-S-isoprenylcysteine O-methyltransferase Ste14
MISHTPWWKGARGEWYVVTQFVLIGLVFFGPSTYLGWSQWTFPYMQFGPVTGDGLILIGAGALLFMGILLFVAAILRLGTNLTAVPYPKEEGTLVETGPYRLVRHPMYSGMVLVAFGWALWVHGWLTIVYAIILLLFFDLKSRREEQWLKAKFSGYDAYQKRVRKLIPFIY